MRNINRLQAVETRSVRSIIGKRAEGKNKE
jgi:hypothetical protein